MYMYVSLSLQPPKPIDSSLYTSPADIKQSKAIFSPEKRHSTQDGMKRDVFPGSHTLPGSSHTLPSPSHGLSSTSHALQGTSHTLPRSIPSSGGQEYAVLPCEKAIGHLDTLTRQRRTYSNSSRKDFPFPDSKFHHVRSASQELPSMYSAIHNSIDAGQPLYSEARDMGGNMLSYDHLAPADPPPVPPPLPPSGIYDHLTPRTRRKLQEEGLQVDLQSLHGRSSPEGIYCLANDSPPQSRDGHTPEGIYSLAGESPTPQGAYSVPHDEGPPQPINGLPQSMGIYSLAGSAPCGINTFGTETGSEMYSYATVPSAHSKAPRNPPGNRPSPKQDRHSPTPPPSLMCRRTPTPPKVPRKPQTRSHTQQAALEQNPDSLYDIPDRVTGRSPMPRPSPVHQEQGSELIYDLPDRVTGKSVIPRYIDHMAPAGSPDSIYALPEKPSSRKTTPKPSALSSHEASPAVADREAEDEDAPPLPPRNYDWSDIEVHM